MKHYKNHCTKLLSKLVLISLLCFTSSCINLEPQPDCTRYYVLRAKSNQPCENRYTTCSVQENKQWVLGVWPVSIPPYLDKRGIAVKVSPTELNYSEWNRWAEPVEKGFSRVLTEDLRLRLPEFNIISYTRSLTEIKDYELYTTLTEFIGDVCCAKVYLKVTWIVKDSLTAKAILIENSTIEVPLTGELCCANIVEGMSEAIARFANFISEKLKDTAEAQ